MRKGGYGSSPYGIQLSRSKGKGVNSLDTNIDISTTDFNCGGSCLSDCEPDLSGSP